MFNKLKEKLKKIDALQQRSTFPINHIEEEHTCVHCGTEYMGRFCPQCGLEDGTSHFTMSNLIHNMLDVVGCDEYGNRSILRTLRDLFWRPGYMIRDYLGGHNVAYFPPFKLLLMLTIVFTLILHWMGIEPKPESVLSRNLENMDGDEMVMAMKPIVKMAGTVVQWFRENIAYSIILQNFFIVTAMWKVYRKRMPYTWTETFMAQMYICCQFMVLAIVQTLVTWRYEDSAFFPYFVTEALVVIFLLYDFLQLYAERHFWGAVYRLGKVMVWIAVQYILAFLLLLLILIIYMVIWAAINGKLTE